MMECFCSCHASTGEKHRPLQKADMPGHRIKQLSKEERDILKKAKGKDFGWRGFK